MNVALFPVKYLPDLGGVEVTTYHLARELLRGKHNLCIITLKKRSDSPYCEDIDGVGVYRFNFPTIDFLTKPLLFKFRGFIRILTVGLRDLFRLYRLLRYFNAHIVNVQFIYQTAFYVTLVSYFLPFKLVVTLQSYGTKKFQPVSRIDRWVFKRVLKKADFVTACSRAVLEDAQKRVPQIKHKSKAIPNGVDSAMFEGAGKADNFGRYILSIGRFVSKKGFDMLLMAFKEVIDKGHKINLLIAGDGGMRQYWEGFADLLQLDGRVIFYKASDRGGVPSLFNGCDFFVLPSRIEPFGIVNLEAMAAGKAIVATKVDGVPEIVEDGYNGILVEPSPEGLACGITRLLEDTELKDTLGANGRKIIESGKYSWDRIAGEYLGVYEKVCSKRDT